MNQFQIELVVYKILPPLDKNINKTLFSPQLQAFGLVSLNYAYIFEDDTFLVSVHFIFITIDNIAGFQAI